MRASLLLLVALLVSLQTSAAEPPRGRLPEAVVPERYRLTLKIDPRQPEFEGVTEIEVRLREPASSIWIHGRGLRVSDARLVLPDRTIRAKYEEVETVTGVSRLDFDTPAPAGKALLRFKHSGPFQRTPQGLYRAEVAGNWYVFSQLSSIDARRVFPGFDEPRFKTPFDVTVITNPRDKVISNASIKSSSMDAGRRKHRFQTTLPLPTELLAFAVGPLDVVETKPLPPTDVRQRPLPLRFVTTKGQGKRFAFAVQHTPDLVLRLERYFGLPFPYPKLDYIASPVHGFAMENPGAIIADDFGLLLGSDPTARQQAIFAEVIAHETAHQWFGDLVTPVWWDDFWLNESFAQWLGSKIGDAWRPELGMSVEQLANTLEAMDTDSLSIGRAIHQPIEDSRQIMSSFDEITYQKGAGVLGMIESYLGEDRFRRGVRLHLQRHPHGTATAEDFFSAMSEAAGDAGVIEAFRSFIDQPGVPTVAVALSSDGTSLSLKQSRYRPLGSTIRDGQLWKIPVCVRLTNGAKTTCALLTGATGQIPLGAAPGSISIFPNAGGRGYYRFVLDSASQRALVETAAGLPGREALALADSVAAGFAAGELTFDDLLTTAAALATHADRTAATKLGYYLTDLHDSLADQAAREGLARTIANIYGPRLRAIGYDPAPRAYAKEGADRELLRRSLTSIVALHGRDPDVRRVFAEAARRSVHNPEAVDAGMRSRVWAVGVQDLRGEFADGLVKHSLESADPHVRLDAAYALGHAEDPDIASRARSLILDARLAPDHAFGMLAAQMQSPITRDATWTWLMQHGDEVIAKLPAIYQPFLVRVGDHFCDAERRDAFAKYLGPRLTKAGMDGLPLARETERITLCMALMSRHEAAIKAAVTDGGAAARRP